MCSQVDRQIEQMVKFIRQEAEEKSNEIKVSAEEVRNTHQYIISMQRYTDDGTSFACIGLWMLK